MPNPPDPRQKNGRIFTATGAVWARSALTAEGWADAVRVAWSEDGVIRDVCPGVEPGETRRVEVLLPAPANLHAHAFQRAMAGLSERRLAGQRDSFWTWRRAMYHFVERLSPEDVQAIAALAYAEMLEAGFGSVGEFHYLHHAPDGTPYDDPAELSHRIFHAASETGIGLTHLPVLYCRGGLSGEPLTGAQRRFGCGFEAFARLWHASERALSAMPGDAQLGVAPHSLRAVAPAELTAATEIAPSAPIHIHIAEQTAEVQAVQKAYGRRPVEWLLDNVPVDDRWCLVHATHMTETENASLARSGAVAGLCPITESNLGDGIFDAPRFLRAHGRYGVGSDSNVRVSLTEELRTLEYGQRLRDRERAILVDDGHSVGRTLFEGVVSGGARALGRGAGHIQRGAFADLVSLRNDDVTFSSLEEDAILDAWVFAGHDRMVDHVWSAGRHVVEDGAHFAGPAIRQRAREVLNRRRAEF